MNRRQLDVLADAVADRIIERLAERLDRRSPVGDLVDAAEIAKRFSVDRSWVYSHAAELGAIRLGDVGDGKRPRLRFDPAVVAERLVARPSPVTAPTGRPRKHARRGAELLPIRGADA